MACSTAATTVVDAGSMAEAVRAAADLARPGDAVVLSPGCASFDWYTGYPARGDDFLRCVDDLLGVNAFDTLRTLPSRPRTPSDL